MRYLPPLVESPEQGRSVTRDLTGSVPWKWLAACLDCGEPHDYRPVRCECGRAEGQQMTWAADDGHPYRSRLPNASVDELRAKYLKETNQNTATVA